MIMGQVFFFSGPAAAVNGADALLACAARFRLRHARSMVYSPCIIRRASRRIALVLPLTAWRDA
jgi:hypothetical protein